jgi:phosphate:Na+ symporter
MLDIFATTFAGIGFFFVGIHFLTDNLNNQANLWLRSVCHSSLGKSRNGFLVGLILGSVTQTTTVAVFILAGLTAAGMTTIKAGLPILLGVNIGTSALIFLATLDIQTVMLIATGIVGITINARKFRSSQPLLLSVFGIGLLFIGIDFLQEGGLLITENTQIRQLLSLHSESYLIGFLAGIVLRVLTMSGAAATLLAMSLSTSDIFDIQLAVITIYGVNFGAAVTTWLFSWGVSGNSRKITRYQVLFDVLGTLILVPLFLLENASGAPLIQALVVAFTDNSQLQMAYVYLIFNLTSAAALVAVLRYQTSQSEMSVDSIMKALRDRARYR